MYPLVSELAADGIPVVVSCRVLGLGRAAYYRWLNAPFTDGQLDEALAFLGQAEGAARAAQLSRVLSEVQLWQARAWLAQQKPEAAGSGSVRWSAPIRY